MSHNHNIGDALSHPCLGNHNLIDYFSSREIAGEAFFARGAESASHGAASLCGAAHCEPAVRRGYGDRLDTRPIVIGDHVFGCPVLRGLGIDDNGSEQGVVGGQLHA